MKRGDVILVRFPHPSGKRGKKRPAVIIQANLYANTLRTVVVAEITKNLAMKDDSACLFVDLNTADGKATGVLANSVISGLLLDTVYADDISLTLGTLSFDLMKQFDECLKVGLGLL